MFLLKGAEGSRENQREYLSRGPEGHECRSGSEQRPINLTCGTLLYGCAGRKKGFFLSARDNLARTKIAALSTSLSPTLILSVLKLAHRHLLWISTLLVVAMSQVETMRVYCRFLPALTPSALQTHGKEVRATGTGGTILAATIGAWIGRDKASS